MSFIDLLNTNQLCWTSSLLFIMQKFHIIFIRNSFFWRCFFNRSDKDWWIFIY